MPQNIITDKIKDVHPGQILAHYKFFKLQEEDGFSFYKNDRHFFLFVFQSPGNDILFLETLEFRVLDKVSLFYFFAEQLGMDALLQNVKDILSIDEFDTFRFSESISKKELIDFYYRLEPSEFLKGTPLEKYAFRRDGSDVLLFKNIQNNPVDLVSFDENYEEVTSEFGNNFGTHFVRNKESDTAMISFHPNILWKDSNRESYNTLITKYNVALIDIISVLKHENISKIFVPTHGKFSHLYKLQMLLRFSNFFSKRINFEITLSPNRYYIELYFNLHGNTMEKLEIMNQVASFQNALKKLLNDHSETIKDNVYEFYSFKVDIHSEGNNHCGKIIFRNNASLLSIIIESFIFRVNSLEECAYKFV